MGFPQHSGRLPSALRSWVPPQFSHSNFCESVIIASTEKLIVPLSEKFYVEDASHM
jgi:hypothetical protein